jgi:uncharacterized repeat protein (TIGR01451 family)
MTPAVHAFTITPAHWPVFFIDTSVTPTLQATYVAYRIYNDSGLNYPDLWVGINGFSGGSVSLGPNEDGLIQLGSLAPGQAKTAFFYLQASQATTTPQTHTVHLYPTRPPAGALASQSFSMTVQETIQANANTVQTVVAGPNPPQLGGLVTVTVQGRSGTIGTARLMVFNPAAYLSWRPDAYQLVGTTVTLTGGNTGSFTDQLYTKASSPSDTAYTAVYTYRTVGTTQTPTPVSAISFISSGTQIKHTRVDNYVQFDPILPADNRLTLGKTASPIQLSDTGPVTFTLIATNSGAYEAVLGDFVDTLPTAPGSPTYVAGSSRFNGVPVSDPAVNGSILTWIGTFAVPAGITRRLTFEVTLPPLNGIYVNQAIAHVGANEIDTTLNTLDHAPAFAAVELRIPLVSGFVYYDANRNRQRDEGETGTGLVLFAKLLAGSAPNGPALRAGAVAATTGAYAFTNVAPGNYLIIVDDNGNLGDVTPTLPAGWIGTEMDNQIRTNVVVAALDVPYQNFGLFHGTTLSGRVFQDTGAGGGIAHDGVQNGTEAGLAGAIVRVADPSGTTTYDTATTDGVGQYSLFLPALLADGTILKVVETNPQNHLSVAGTAGNTGGTYDRAADAVTFTFQSGAVYTGVNFGDIPLNRFGPDNQQFGLPGGVVIYVHTFTAGSAGQVTFVSSNQPNPSLPGWTQVLYRDADCDGELGSADPVLLNPIVLGAGEQVCILVKEFIPLEASWGSRDVITIAAAFDYLGAVPGLSTHHYVTDITTVGNPTTAGLTLVKSADKATAKPGEVITYTITYANTSSGHLQNIVLYDSTPAYTTFLSATNGPLATNLTGVILRTPALGSAGSLQWTFTGTLAPARSGTVSFQVQLER